MREIIVKIIYKIYITVTSDISKNVQIYLYFSFQQFIKI